MQKNVLVIASSLRKNGNSNTLANAFVDGAKASNHNVEIIYLANYNIEFCKGCLSCQTTHQCVIKDDMALILEKMKNADVLAFATPVYFYSMTGQMKTLLDRTNPLYDHDYKFKDIYLLASSADESMQAIDGTIKELSGWIECFENTKLVNTVLANGVTNVNDIVNHDALNKAYQLGKEL